MKKRYAAAAFLFLLCLLTACTSVKRFRSARYMAQDHTLVDMELFGTQLSLEDPDDQGRDLWDLSAGAQTQLIQILDSRYPDNVQFMDALSNSYPQGGGTGLPDFTRKKLRMIFTISKKRDFSAINDPASRFSPADRIEYLSFTLEIPEKYNLSYTGWNRYVTEYGEIEIADVSFSQSLQLEAEASAGPQAGGTAEGTSGRQERQQVRSRYLKLNGSMDDRRILVEAEGTREIDLTGNVVADISLGFAGFPEKVAVPQFMGNAGDTTGIPVVTGLRFVEVLVPRLEEVYDTIKARLTCNYIYRHVQSGWDTYQEWDDRVEYYEGNVEKEVPLFTRKDYLPRFYCIGMEGESGRALRFRDRNNTPYLLQFRNYTEAVRVLDHLHRSVGASGEEVTIGSHRLFYGGSPLTYDRAEVPDLKVLPVF